MAAFASAFGQLDLLVNNAGSNLRKLAVDVTWADWDAVMASNLRGAFFLSQQVGRRSDRGRPAGAIVNIASTHGLVGAAERSTYGIAKGALIQMTRMLAIEWAEHGIRVNAIAPGRLDTRSPSRAARTDDPSYMQAMLARIPLRRLATVDEVAAAVCYLAEPASGVVHRANARAGRWDHRGVNSLPGSDSFQRRPDNSSTLGFFLIAARTVSAQQYFR